VPLPIPLKAAARVLESVVDTGFIVLYILQLLRHTGSPVSRRRGRGFERPVPGLPEDLVYRLVLERFPLPAGWMTFRAAVKAMVDNGLVERRRWVVGGGSKALLALTGRGEEYLLRGLDHLRSRLELVESVEGLPKVELGGGPPPTLEDVRGEFEEAAGELSTSQLSERFGISKYTARKWRRMLRCRRRGP